VWEWPYTGKVSPPNPPELQSTREGVGIAAKALRKSHEHRNDAFVAAGADGVRGCQLLNEAGPHYQYKPRT
jgi:hypothetical protein